VFRPEKFWPGHTDVRISAKPTGSLIPGSASAGNLRWVGTIDRSFKIGRSQVIKVDNASHSARIVRDGKVVRTVGVSLGKAGWETRSGTKVMTEKYRTKTMTGASIGAEEDYTLQVPYAIRLTNSGEFIHAAPWASDRIGRRNGSHGCTNLRTSDAKWVYDNSLVGDPVVTTGTGRQMEPWNGAGGPWNVSWNNWSKGLAA
jgi:lipoprotein-anchoring transpeptidase ErfK/SrfK